MLRKTDRDIARSSVLFGALPAAVFDTVSARARVVTLGAGQSLFHLGDPARDVFCVLSGLIKLSIDQKDGAETLIEVFQPGQSFAEALAFRDAVYPASASALTDTRVLSVPNERLRAELRTDPDAYDAVLGATYAHLHKLVRQIEQLKSNSGLERLAQYILATAGTARDGGDVEIPYEKQVLASLLGIKPETLSRSFRKLEDHGVALRGRRIILHDREGLARLLSRRV